MSKLKIVFWVVGIIISLIIIAIVALIVLQPNNISLRQNKLMRAELYESDYGRGDKMLAATPMQSMAAVGGVNKAVAPQARKLIKRAELNLEVTNCEETAKKIIELVNSVSGIILDSEVQKYQNEAKKGQTVLKVQPKDFDAVLSKLKEFGRLDLERITGEDVTEEYVDLESRLKNLQIVKERLMAILQEKARTVKDILEVERELARVGGEIESIQGRMKYLDRQVDLATITVNYYEPKAITPEGLNIFKRLKETVRSAVEAFINVFNAGIIVVFALLPICIWLGIILVLVLSVRKFFFRKR